MNRGINDGGDLPEELLRVRGSGGGTFEAGLDGAPLVQPFWGGILGDEEEVTFNAHFHLLQSPLSL